jgi:hypothetical protein
MSHTDGPWWATPPDEESIYWEVWDGYGHTATVIHSLSETGAGLAVGAASPYLEIIRKAEGRE